MDSHLMCRLCGSEEGIKINIFEEGTDYVKKIHKILPITINEHDPLPKTMCHRCSFKVNDFFEFRTKCIKAQEIFKSKVPWLKDKQGILAKKSQPPMVEVPLCSVNSISPSEKKFPVPSICSPSYIDGSDSIVIEDSPPYNAGTSTSSLNCEDSATIKSTGTQIKKKRRTRSIWDSKKRKRKYRGSCKITEVYTTSVDEYQRIGNIENDPLQLSSIDQNESKDAPSLTTKTPKEEQRNILTTDNTAENMPIPKYILVTNIPRVGLVYTCEKCGRTFLSPQPARQHTCAEINSYTESRSKEESGSLVQETSNQIKFYTCNECGKVFSRHSQLVTHEKKHNEVVSSSDYDQPINHKKRKHFTKRKKKSELPNPNPNTNHLSNDDMESRITRHYLLSSDSE